jgi:hypothetical protein
VIAGNRFDRNTRGLIAPMAQEGLLVVDCSSGTVAEAARAMTKAALAAYFHGYYDPTAIGELLGEVAARRGVRFDLSVFFNDQSEFFDDEPALLNDGLDMDQVSARGLLRDTVLFPIGTLDAHGPTVFLKAQSGADISRLDLMADTAHLPPPKIEAVLRGIETIMLEAAYRDVALAEIPALTGLGPTACT